MATYIAKNANDEQVNLIEIDPAQIESWQALTGLTLELPPEPDPQPTPTTDDPDAATMEAALNELGVITRE